MTFVVPSAKVAKTLIWLFGWLMTTAGGRPVFASFGAATTLESAALEQPDVLPRAPRGLPASLEGAGLVQEKPGRRVQDEDLEVVAVAHGDRRRAERVAVVAEVRPAAPPEDLEPT